jgi:hypothetical protein
MGSARYLQTSDENPIGIVRTWTEYTWPIYMKNMALNRWFTETVCGPCFGGGNFLLAKQLVVRCVCISLNTGMWLLSIAFHAISAKWQSLQM